MRCYNYFLLIILISISACRKEAPDAPNFELTFKSLTIKAGEAVEFDFTGNPDNLMFYSGEVGSRYDSKDRGQTKGIPTIEFRNHVLYLNADNEMRLLLSKNYNGTTDSASIAKAKWVDITHKATWANGGDTTHSGKIDLTEFAMDSAQKVYFAWQYRDKPKALGTARQANWTIRDIKVNNTFNDGVSFALITMAENKWTRFSFLNSNSIWSMNATRLNFPGGNNVTPENHDWVISKEVDLNYSENEKGLVVKNMVQNKSSFKYIYQKAGTYDVVVEAVNANKHGSKSLLKRYSITVLP